MGSQLAVESTILLAHTNPKSAANKKLEAGVGHIAQSIFGVSFSSRWVLFLVFQQQLSATVQQFLLHSYDKRNTVPECYA